MMETYFYRDGKQKYSIIPLYITAEIVIFCANAEVNNLVKFLKDKISESIFLTIFRRSLNAHFVMFLIVFEILKITFNKIGR